MIHLHQRDRQAGGSIFRSCPRKRRRSGFTDSFIDPVPLSPLARVAMPEVRPEAGPTSSSSFSVWRKPRKIGVLSGLPGDRYDVPCNVAFCAANSDFSDHFLYISYRYLSSSFHHQVFRLSFFHFILDFEPAYPFHSHQNPPNGYGQIDFQPCTRRQSPPAPRPGRGCENSAARRN